MSIDMISTQLQALIDFEKNNLIERISVDYKLDINELRKKFMEMATNGTVSSEFKPSDAIESSDETPDVKIEVKPVKKVVKKAPKKKVVKEDVVDELEKDAEKPKKKAPAKKKEAVDPDAAPKKRGRRKITKDDLFEAEQVEYDGETYYVDKESKVYKGFETPVDVGVRLIDGSLKFNEKYTPGEKNEVVANNPFVDGEVA